MRRRRTASNLAITLLGACAVVGACLAWKLAISPEQRARELFEARAALDQQISSERAMLIRERAECVAAGHEFGPAHADACWAHYRIQVEISERFIEKAANQRDALR